MAARIPEARRTPTGITAVMLGNPHSEATEALVTVLPNLWLTETIRLREEHAGPLEDQEANRLARAAGGDLATRIRHRARWLAERDGLTEALRHWLQGARLAADRIGAARRHQRRRPGLCRTWQRKGRQPRSMCSGPWAVCWS